MIIRTPIRQTHGDVIIFQPSDSPPESGRAVFMEPDSKRRIAFSVVAAAAAENGTQRAVPPHAIEQRDEDR